MTNAELFLYTSIIRISDRVLNMSRNICQRKTLFFTVPPPLSLRMHNPMDPSKINMSNMVKMSYYRLNHAIY
jgi:hypothetical protein